MTFEEWKDEMTLELQDDGFTVETFAGFPFIPNPIPHADKLRLLNRKSTLPSSLSIYADGVIVMPGLPPPRKS